MKVNNGTPVRIRWRRKAKPRWNGQTGVVKKAHIGQPGSRVHLVQLNKPFLMPTAKKGIKELLISERDLEILEDE